MFDFQQGGMILKKYLPILKNSPFFTGLTDNEILSILHCVKATAVSQKRDSYIFRAGDSTEVMGLVVSGCVLVIQEDLWGIGIFCRNVIPVISLVSHMQQARELF